MIVATNKVAVREITIKRSLDGENVAGEGATAPIFLCQLAQH